MEKLITITVTDEKGNSFSRDWRREAHRPDVLRWMAENEDLPFYVDVSKITTVTITETEK